MAYVWLPIPDPPAETLYYTPYWEYLRHDGIWVAFTQPELQVSLSSVLYLPDRTPVCLLYPLCKWNGVMHVIGVQYYWCSPYLFLLRNHDQPLFAPHTHKLSCI